MSLTQYLDAAGKLIQQDQVMDNGTKRIDWYDVADTKTWTQQTDLFDTAGARTQSSFVNDDSTKINTYYDTTNTQPYSSLTQYLDTAGKLTRQFQVKDDGTKQTDWYDVTDAQTWAQQTYSYDAAGATTKKAWLNDDGTKTIIFYDVAKTKGYASLTQYLDAAGKLSKQIQVNDDGTKQTDWYDLADAQAWWQQTDWNNAAGALTQRSYLDDSKTRVTTKYDPTDAATWTTIVQNFDTTGKMTKQLKTNDDGTNETTIYDVADAQTWAQQIDVVDSAGKLTQRTYLYDDNTRVVTAYNTSTGTYTSEKHYNAAGQLVWSKSPSGGPGANITNYDFDSTKTWTYWSETWMAGSAGGPGVQWYLTYSTKWDDGRVTSGKPPVLLDLNGDDHIDLRPFDPLATAGPAFDWDGDGERDATAWIGPGDGLLAIDLAKNGEAGSDGIIDQARELAFASWVESDRMVSDLEGLRLVFDTNQDNLLDAQDARWNEFRVWQDHNQNGISEQGELLTMSEAGIKLVNLLPSTDGARAFDDGSMITGTSSMTMTDGTTRLVADTTLSFRPSSLNSQVA